MERRLDNGEDLDTETRKRGRKTVEGGSKSREARVTEEVSDWLVRKQLGRTTARVVGEGGSMR